MTTDQKNEIGWVWTSGATALLLAVGGLLWQVKGLSEQMIELRDKGSPVLKARMDVVETLSLGQQKQIDALAIELRGELRDIKLDGKEIRRLLEMHMREKNITP